MYLRMSQIRSSNRKARRGLLRADFFTDTESHCGNHEDEACGFASEFKAYPSHEAGMFGIRGLDLVLILMLLVFLREVVNSGTARRP